MRFIVILCSVFGIALGLIAAHYLAFDHTSRVQSLELLSKKVRDAQLSQSFISNEYKGFVYAK